MNVPFSDSNSSNDVTRLFKYRALGSQHKHERQLQLEYAIDIIAQHRLYVSPPTSFNDPFDCRENLSFEGSEEQKLERAVQKIMKDKPSISISEARLAAPNRLRIVEQHGRTQIKALIENQLGIVSFAGSRDNLLMWAHYANAHRGIVIEFDANKLSGDTSLRSVDFFGEALQVQYVETLPTTNFFTEDSVKQVKKLLLTKSSHWKYEQEFRMVVKDRKRSPSLSFTPEYVTAIYLGCRIEDSDRRAVLDCLAARSPSVPVFDAKPSTLKYGLDFTLVSH
jgi:hypothetical protein